MLTTKAKYATPSLKAYGSVRNLTGGSSICQMDSDGTLMVLTTVNSMGQPCV